MMWQYGLMQAAQDVNHLEGRAKSPAFFVSDRLGSRKVYCCTDWVQWVNGSAFCTLFTKRLKTSDQAVQAEIERGIHAFLFNFLKQGQQVWGSVRLRC